MLGKQTFSSQERQRAASSAAQNTTAAAPSQASQSVRIILIPFNSHFFEWPTLVYNTYTNSMTTKLQKSKTTTRPNKSHNKISNNGYYYYNKCVFVCDCFDFVQHNDGRERRTRIKGKGSWDYGCGMGGDLNEEERFEKKKKKKKKKKCISVSWIFF